MKAIKRRLTQIFSCYDYFFFLAERVLSLEFNVPFYSRRLKITLDKKCSFFHSRKTFLLFPFRIFYGLKMFLSPKLYLTFTFANNLVLNLYNTLILYSFRICIRIMAFSLQLNFRVAQYSTIKINIGSRNNDPY